jgi:Co/Zn/Cd efflux system component
MGMVLAGVLLVPGVATLWTAWHKFTAPAPPSPLALSLAGAGALAVNLSCAIMLARYRQHSGSLTRAAFLSARNDVLANLAIIAAGFVTAFTRSGWPDLVVGLGIALMNANAAKEIYQVAREDIANFQRLSASCKFLIKSGMGRSFHGINCKRLRAKTGVS